MFDLQIGKKIKELSKKSNLTIKDLCKKIEMTESGFNIALKNNTLKIETLQKISEVLEVEIGYFFESEQNNNKIDAILIFDEFSKNLDKEAKQIKQIEKIFERYCTEFENNKDENNKALDKLFSNKKIKHLLKYEFDYFEVILSKILYIENYESFINDFREYLKRKKSLK